MIENPIPTFNVLESGKRKESLIHCFLQRTTVYSGSIQNISNVVAKNGETYSVIWDFIAPVHNQDIPVIISFQKHTYGNFAIIRQVIQTEKPAEITFLSSYSGL